MLKKFTSLSTVTLSLLLTNHSIAKEQLTKPTVSDKSPQFIVVLDAEVEKDKINHLVMELNSKHPNAHNSLKTFRHINGFYGELTEQQRQLLKLNPKVKSIEPNQVITLGASSATDTSASRRIANSWGVDRIDQQTLPLDNAFSPAGFGSGVHAYILSTGIRTSHSEFNGRASWVFTASDINDGNDDGNGQGTHMAGTLAGATYGVASDANVYGVKILNNSGVGSLAGLIEGLDYITNHHQQPAVAAIGVTTHYSVALNDAIAAAVAAGISVAVPSGDESRDACNYSPASATAAITVGATFADDRVSNSSNSGDCVDIYAPGLYVRSAWHTGDYVNNSISHSPVATAHVAGAAAIIRGLYPQCDVSQVKDNLLASSHNNVLTDVPANSPNLLLGVHTAQTAAAQCGPGEWLTFFQSYHQLTHFNRLSDWENQDGSAHVTSRQLTDADLPQEPLGLSSISTLALSGNQLTHVDFMQGIKEVRQDLHLATNKLTSFTGLSDLTTVKGYFQIGVHNPMTHLTGLEQLTLVGKSLNISYTANLSDISALSNLQSVGSIGTESWRDLVIARNSGLQNLDGLEKLSFVGDDVMLYENDLHNVDGLIGLTTINGSLMLQLNRNLSSLAGLTNLTSVGGYLLLNGNDALTNLNGLQALTSVGNHFTIEDLNNLKDISALANLTSVGGLGLLMNHPSSYQQKPALGSPFCNAISPDGIGGAIEAKYRTDNSHSYNHATRAEICQ